MSTNPPTTNADAALAVQIMTSIFSAIDTLVETASIAEAPFLADPGINLVFKDIVEGLSNKILAQLSALAVNGVVAIQVISEDATFMSARAELASANLKGDTNAISTARQKVDAAFAALVTWDGTAQPGG